MQFLIARRLQLQFQKEKVLRIRHHRIGHVPDVAGFLKTELLKESMGSFETRVGPKFDTTKFLLFSPIDRDLHQVPTPIRSAKIGVEVEPLESADFRRILRIRTSRMRTHDLALAIRIVRAGLQHPELAAL